MANPQVIKGRPIVPGICQFLPKVYPRVLQDLSTTDRIDKGDKRDWKWTPEMENRSTSLRERFTTAPILIHLDPQRQCIVETDASDFALGAVLSQEGRRRYAPPRCLSLPQIHSCGNQLRDPRQRILAIVDAFRPNMWRQYVPEHYETGDYLH